MTIKDILKYVDKETAAECEKILEEARSNVKRIESEAEEKRKLSDEVFKKELAAARQKTIESALRSARIKLRLETLNAKKRILDEIYNKTLREKIEKKLSEEKTVKLYEGLLKRIPLSEYSSEAELMVCPSEIDLWKKIKNCPPHARLSGNREITKGFVYKTPSALWDFTLENLLLSFRSNTESEAAQKLFGG